MVEAKGKIIKKSVTTKTESDYSVSETRSPLIEGEVYDASQVARDLVQKAEQQASEIVAKAMQERDRISAEAKEQGYHEGLASATEWVIKAKEAYQRTMESGKGDLKLLAVKIAEKIIGQALEMDPELISEIVTQAIRTLRQQKNVTLRCNEDDYEVLKKHEKGFLEHLGQGGTITLVADPKIRRGGCLVESEIGIVDARLDVQLKTLQKVLMSK